MIEAALQDFAEQPLPERFDHRRLVREVGVHRVRGHAHPGRDPAHRRRARPALVQELQGGVEDFPLAEDAPGAPTTSLRGCWHRAEPLLDTWLDNVQCVYSV